MKMPSKQTGNGPIIRIGIAAAIALVLAISHYSLDALKEALTNKKTQLSTELKQHQVKVKNINHQKDSFSESLILWDRLKDDSKLLQGLRIDEGRRQIIALQTRFKLVNMITEFSPPTEIPNEAKVEGMVLVSSSVSVRFGSLTDQYAFAFIKALTEELAGYIKIKSLKVVRKYDLTQDYIVDISNGNFTPLIEVELTFDWQDIKEVSSKKQTKAAS